MEKMLGLEQNNGENCFNQNKVYELLIEQPYVPFMCWKRKRLTTIDEAKSYLLWTKICVAQFLILFVLEGIVGLILTIVAIDSSLSKSTQNDIYTYFSYAAAISVNPAIIALNNFGKFVDIIPEMKRYQMLKKFNVINLILIFVGLQPVII